MSYCKTLNLILSCRKTSWTVTILGSDTFYSGGHISSGASLQRLFGYLDY